MPNIVTRTLDVTQDEQTASVVAGIVEAEGRIDCVVNNAGSMCIGVCDFSSPPWSSSSEPNRPPGPIVDIPPSAALGKPEPISIGTSEALTSDLIRCLRSQCGGSSPPFPCSLPAHGRPPLGFDRQHRFSSGGNTNTMECVVLRREGRSPLADRNPPL